MNAHALRNMPAVFKLPSSAPSRPANQAPDVCSTGNRTTSPSSSLRDDSSDASSTQSSRARHLADVAARRFRKLDYQGALEAFEAADTALGAEFDASPRAEALRQQVLQGRGIVRMELGDVEMALKDLRGAEHFYGGNQHHGNNLNHARVLMNISKCEELLGDQRGAWDTQDRVSEILAKVEEKDLMCHESVTVQALRQWLRQQVQGSR